MTSISNNNIISINAGDYFKYPIFLNAGNKMYPLRYKLQGNDKLYFAIIEPNQPFECGVVRKIYTKNNLNCFGDVEIELSSDDTKNIVPGRYQYEIVLSVNRNNKDYITTVVPKQ